MAHASERTLDAVHLQNSDRAPPAKLKFAEMIFWAKTVPGNSGVPIPGITVEGHCVNVGNVAAEIESFLPPAVRRLLPTGTATLAAVHDIGKITLGFQAKCPPWLAAQHFDDLTRRQIAHSESDHAKVSQHFLENCLRVEKARGWAVAVGAHHGKPKGTSIRSVLEALAAEMQAERAAVAARLIEHFGPLPTIGPRRALYRDDPALWLLAGLISVADWIGSNEVFFPADRDLAPDLSRAAAASALGQIGWPGGRLVGGTFEHAFGFAPNPVQRLLLATATSPCLVIVEAPMGCGKTEAALALARQLIVAGHHHGFYFALPTQVTSNRIHRRVTPFLCAALADPAHLRLAHGTSWLEANADLHLRPARTGGFADGADDPQVSALEARSWFASSKQALLAPYGVGTIDQALQGMVAVKHFFVRRFALAGKVVILDEVHSYDVYTGTLVTALVRELLQLGCTVIVLSATLTAERRRELLAAAGSSETTPDNPAYPLLSIAPPSTPAVQVAVDPPPPKTIRVRAGLIGEEEIIAELIARAAAGQHVLWIRNTVAEAQLAFRCLRGDAPVARDPAERIALGLLHSRFPHCRRQELEEEWLERLGKHRPPSGPGSILVATQVVEQSVDIDLDFIVSDLAPTDMLLQRLGRLWRHPRDQRAAPAPDFWVRIPELPPAADLAALAKALGRSSKVYAPWVLLRSAAVFSARSTLTLPAEIRPLLEATYAPPRSDEPAAWTEAHDKLQEERSRLVLNAEAALRVLGLPCRDDDAPEALTRRAGPPTATVLLLAALEPLPGRTHRLVALDGTTHVASDFEWTLATARFIHPWLVRVPRWMVAAAPPAPDWLRLHVPGGAVLALVGEHGRLLWDGEAAPATYHPDFGVQADRITPSRTASFIPADDDEFDY